MKILFQLVYNKLMMNYLDQILFCYINCSFNFKKSYEIIFQKFFQEIERYNENINLILRINKKSKYSYLSKEIYYGISYI